MCVCVSLGQFSGRKQIHVPSNSTHSFPPGCPNVSPDLPFFTFGFRRGRRGKHRRVKPALPGRAKGLDRRAAGGGWWTAAWWREPSFLSWPRRAGAGILHPNGRDFMVIQWGNYRFLSFLWNRFNSHLTLFVFGKTCGFPWDGRQFLNALRSGVWLHGEGDRSRKPREFTRRRTFFGHPNMICDLFLLPSIMDEECHVIPICHVTIIVITQRLLNLWR